MSEITLTLHKLHPSMVLAVMQALSTSGAAVSYAVEQSPPAVDAKQAIEGQGSHGSAGDGNVSGANPVPQYDQVGNYQPTENVYNPNVAQGVFGGQAPNFQQVPHGAAPHSAPQGTAATAPALINATPAAFVAGGTPGSAGPVDAKGRPWDARIHSSSKERLAKTQEWKLKRNVDKLLVAQVEAELDSIRNGAAVAHAPAVAAGVQRFNDQVVPQGYTVGQPHAAAPGGYVPPPAILQPQGPTYGDVFGKLTGAIATQKITPQTAASMLQYYGVADAQALEAHPDKWVMIMNEVDRLSAGVQ